MNEDIYSFKGPHFFLSNFHSCRVLAFGKFASTVEHAYQAAKAASVADRDMILGVKMPAEAKRLGKKIEIRDDWEEVKETVMRVLLNRKFSQDPFRTQLINTKNAYIIEGNDWGDRYWGAVLQDNCWIGKNRLGEMLMEIRSTLALTEGL